MDEIPPLEPPENHPLRNPPVVERDSNRRNLLWYARLDFGRRASIVVLLHITWLVFRVHVDLVFVFDDACCVMT